MLKTIPSFPALPYVGSSSLRITSSVGWRGSNFSENGWWCVCKVIFTELQLEYISRYELFWWWQFPLPYVHPAWSISVLFSVLRTYNCILKEFFSLLPVLIPQPGACGAFNL